MMEQSAKPQRYRAEVFVNSPLHGLARMLCYGLLSLNDLPRPSGSFIETATQCLGNQVNKRKRESSGCNCAGAHAFILIASPPTNTLRMASSAV